MLSFFLQNSNKTFYEVAPIDSVWVINAPFNLENKDDQDYLAILAAASKRYGEKRNVFGKYLTTVAKMVEKDREALDEGATLVEIFASREKEILTKTW